MKALLGMLSKRGMGNGERGTGNGERRTKTGNGKMKNENNQRIRIEVTDGDKVQVSVSSHFSFFYYPLPVYPIMGISKQTVFVSNVSACSSQPCLCEHLEIFFC